MEWLFWLRLGLRANINTPENRRLPTQYIEYIYISIYLFLNHLTLINSSLFIKLPSVKVSNSPPDFVLSAFLGCGEEPSSKPWLFRFPLDVENRHKNKWETCIFNAIYCPLSEQYRASRWRLLRRLILGQPAKYSPPFKKGAKCNEKALTFFVTFFTITLKTMSQYSNTRSWEIPSIVEFCRIEFNNIPILVQNKCKNWHLILSSVRQNNSYFLWIENLCGVV